jgi:chorismate lyase
VSWAKRANWYAHVGSLRTTQLLAGWLSDNGSLTAKLIAHSRQFRVQCLGQGRAFGLSDEMQVLGLPRRVQVIEREVLLICDGVPVVFAHTAVPLSCTAADWPLFTTLGNRSLGTTLFNDPQVRRGSLHYARLQQGHALVQRAQQAIQGGLPAQCLARRSLFWRRRGILLVTEVFLPTLNDLLLAHRAPGSINPLINPLINPPGKPV